MTSAVFAPSSGQGQMDANATTTAGPPPRKRRRRTAAGGAADDCFACRNRAVQCDRKRPYCTQCIEGGKECSGYKTTLTWGVGVASRGKLRGLSCPIAHKNADGSDIIPAEVEAKRRKSSSAKPKKEEAVSKTSSVPDRKATSQTSTKAELPTHSHIYPPASAPTPIPQLQSQWQSVDFEDHARTTQALDGRQDLHPPSLQHLQTALGPQYDGVNMLQSGRSIGSYAETEYHSPMEYPQTPSYFATTEQPGLEPIPSFAFSDQQMSGISGASYAAEASPGIETLQSSATFASANTMDSNMPEVGPVDEMLFSHDPTLRPMIADRLGYNAFDQLDVHAEDETDNDRKDLSLIDTRFVSPFYNISPRLQTLMNYYDRHICPFLVTFDGNENPYRKHILQLAVRNDGLQNAIAALATNNLRMRKKEPRHIGGTEESAHMFDDIYSREYDEPTPEESCYKQMSIDQLNMQLTDVRAAQDDSVLATLLILCLFHVCDSGFSKFKTQLAGVQKLLSLRSANTQSDFTRWVEMFFIWFDVLTSSVNDRQTQIKGESLAMMDFSSNLGALEQFSGCDGRLFKLIARLGKLNLLAQGRPVKDANGEQQLPRSLAQLKAAMRSARRKKPGSRYPANRSLVASDYENMDGNGWGTPILSSDEDADGSADEESQSSDERHEFWAEWHDIRDRLQAWRIDLSNISSPDFAITPTNPEELNAGQRDLIHINESFRYSALLYTERLGYPLLPSSHVQFQNLVAQALYHITALPVTSCVNKFLLWPLFITGTECVDEAAKRAIRSRCIEVQRESGFYNNISTLEILEKVWSEAGSNLRGSEFEEVTARRRDSEASRSGRYGQVFRWRKAMDRVDGEYIVI